MQVEFEMEYNDEEDLFFDLELEEIEILTNEDVKSARGLSFKEMSLAVEVIQQKQATEEIELQAAQTISLMQQTALFDMMMEQLDGGRQGVADMLDKYDANPSEDTSETLIPKDLEEFNLNSLL